MKGFRGPGRCRGDRGIICRARSGGFSERHKQKRSDYEDDDEEEDLRQGYPRDTLIPLSRSKTLIGLWGGFEAEGFAAPTQPMHSATRTVKCRHRVLWE